MDQKQQRKPSHKQLIAQLKIYIGNGGIGEPLLDGKPQYRELDRVDLLCAWVGSALPKDPEKAFHVASELADLLSQLSDMAINRGVVTIKLIAAIDTLINDHPDPAHDDLGTD